MKKILFICTGNTCRSPMAEGIFNSMIEKAGRSDVKASSAGIYAGYSQAASKNAVSAAAKYGCDISKHISKPVSQELIKDSDLILCMTKTQADTLKSLYPACSSKIRRLANNKDISDPYGLSSDEYLVCCKQIASALQSIIDEVSNEQC